VRTIHPLLAVALSIVLVIATASPALADELQTKVNAVRTNDLSMLAAADRIAQHSAEAQAAAGALSHTDLNPLLGVCSAAGEVVGAGATVDAIFDAFRGSPLHWDLITEPRWTSMGTGTAVSATGTLYVSIVFCQGAAGSASPTTTTAPAATTTTMATPSPPVTAPTRSSAVHRVPTVFRLPQNTDLGPCQLIDDPALHTSRWDACVWPRLASGTPFESLLRLSLGNSPYGLALGLLVFLLTTDG
jgi:hypothetical protein